MYKLGTFITFRDLVWRNNEEEDIFTGASLPSFDFTYGKLKY